MKSFFLFLFLLPHSVFANDNIYYCSEIDANGFKPNEDNGYERTGFVVERFTAKIDFEKEYFESDEINMSFTNCITEDKLESVYPGSTMMTCSTGYGAMFNINKQSLKFTLASGLGWVFGTDTIQISYGSCEKF